MKWLYIAISLLFVACAIKEEETFDINYRPSLFLSQHFINDGGEDVVDEVVNTTTYYIYGSEGNLYRTYVNTSNSFVIDSVLYGVPEDTYTVVACGNLSVAKLSSENDVRSKANISISSVSQCKGTENLFMNIKEYDVQREKDTITSKDIYFNNCAIHVTMTLKADENVEGGLSNIESYLTIPSGYDFSGNLLNTTANIYPEFESSSKYEKKADFYVYRFSANENNVKINLEEMIGGEANTMSEFPISIPQYLKYYLQSSNPEWNEERIQEEINNMFGKREMDLNIEIDISPIGIIVKINDWIIGSKQEEDL